MKTARKFAASSSPSSRAGVVGVAAEWLARREGGLNAQEHEQFSQWLLADERHAAAVKEIASAWRFMQSPRLTGQADELALSVERRVRERTKSRRRRIWAVAATGMAAAALVMLAVLPIRRPGAIAGGNPSAHVETKPERQMLADGSVVELNAGAEIAAGFSPAQRGVKLLRGEAHFVVAKGDARPFVVTAGAVSVRAEGTEFAVRFDPFGVNVLVTEGRVAVNRLTATPEATASSVHLEGGNRVAIPAALPITSPLKVEPATSGDIQAALAWRSMRVEFTATPLADIVARFNRQNRVQISIGSADLKELCISGIFWADDPEGFSRLIEASAGLKATRESDDRILLSRR